MCKYNRHELVVCTLSTCLCLCVYMYVYYQGTLQGTIDDLTRQLEQNEGMHVYMIIDTCITMQYIIFSSHLLLCFMYTYVHVVVIRNLKSEVAQLRGENDALRREVEKLRREVSESKSTNMHTYTFTCIWERVQREVQIHVIVVFLNR